MSGVRKAVGLSLLEAVGFAVLELTILRDVNSLPFMVPVLVLVVLLNGYLWREDIRGFFDPVERIRRQGYERREKAKRERERALIESARKLRPLVREVEYDPEKGQVSASIVYPRSLRRSVMHMMVWLANHRFMSSRLLHWWAGRLGYRWVETEAD